jgi:pSer/pThr/pTyr-binding forkhead associated (FHA) protein
MAQVPLVEAITMELHTLDGSRTITVPGAHSAPLTIGRVIPGAAFRYLNVSRDHCTVVHGQQPRTIVLVDLNSSNGTFVNNVRVEILHEVVLVAGDTVVLGVNGVGGNVVPVGGTLVTSPPPALTLVVAEAEEAGEELVSPPSPMDTGGAKRLRPVQGPNDTKRQRPAASAADEALQRMCDDVRVMGDKYQLLDGLHVWSMSCVTASRLIFTYTHGTGATHDVVVDADQADQVDEEEEKEATKEATKSTVGGANGRIGGRRLVARLCGPGADAADGETMSSGRRDNDSGSDDDDDDIDGMCQSLSCVFLPAVAAATVPRMAGVANGEDLSQVLLDLEVHFDRASSLVEEVRVLESSVVASPSALFAVVAVEQVGADEDDEEEEERAAGVEVGQPRAAPLCNVVVTGTNFEKECKVEMTLGLRRGYPFATMDVTVEALLGLSDAHVERIKCAVQVSFNTLYQVVAGRDWQVGQVGRGGGW